MRDQLVACPRKYPAHFPFPGTLHLYVNIKNKLANSSLGGRGEGRTKMPPPNPQRIPVFNPPKELGLL